MHVETAIEKYDRMYKYFRGARMSRKLPGEGAEYLLRELLRTRVGDLCCVGHGLVIGNDDAPSRELDVILFDKGSALLEIGDLVVVKAPHVIAVVQVKAWQTTGDISTVAANLDSVRTLNSQIDTYAFFWTFHSRRQFERAGELAKQHRLSGIYGMRPCPGQGDERIPAPGGVNGFLERIMRVVQAHQAGSSEKGPN